MLNGSVDGDWESEGHQGFLECYWQALLVGECIITVTLKNSLIVSFKKVKQIPTISSVQFSSVAQ